MTHPIPQELRDRFDQIEDDICRNKIERDAVFTQMRTAVQAYFMASEVEPVAAQYRCRPIRKDLPGHVEGKQFGPWQPASLDRLKLKGERFIDSVGYDVEMRALYDRPPVQPSHGLTWEAQGEANQYMLFRDGRWFAAVQMNGEQLVAEQEVFFSSIATPHKCLLPPEGWTCSRRAGHSGPCAATPVTAD